MFVGLYTPDNSTFIRQIFNYQYCSVDLFRGSILSYASPIQKTYFGGRIKGKMTYMNKGTYQVLNTINSRYVLTITIDKKNKIIEE